MENRRKAHRRSDASSQEPHRREGAAQTRRSTERRPAANRGGQASEQRTATQSRQVGSRAVSSGRSSSGQTQGAPTDGRRAAQRTRKPTQKRAQAGGQARRPQQERERLKNRAAVSAHPGRRPAAAGLTQEQLVPIMAGGFIVVLLGICALLLFHPWKYNVTVNGTEVTVKRNATLGDIVEAGYATPAAGDLMSVDGKLLKEGGGDPFAATVDGKASNDPATVVPKHAVVEMTDGANATEDCDVTETPIPHGERTWDTEMGSYWNGSLHVYEEGEDGLSVTKVGKVSGTTVTEQTKAPVDSGYHIYTCNPGEDKVIALTFDDGPWDTTTDGILDVLEANGAKATFFTIGNQIPEHTAQIQREKSLGCQVCTHTYDHAEGSGQGANLTYMSSEEQIWEVQQGYAAIKDALGEEPSHILRAPGGNFYGETLTILQPYVDAEIGWDVDTEDWRLPGADAIYEAIMSVQPGQVILMHDGGGDRTQTVEAVSRAVPELVAQGYKLVTVDELLAYDPPVEDAPDAPVSVG